MLDLLGIVFSGTMMLWIMVRAMQMDSTQPWFQRLPRKTDQAAEPTQQRRAEISDWRRRR